MLPQRYSLRTVSAHGTAFSHGAAGNKVRSPAAATPTTKKHQDAHQRASARKSFAIPTRVRPKHSECYLGLGELSGR